MTISHVKGTNWQIRFVCFDRRHHRGRRHALLPHVLGGGVTGVTAVGQLSDWANGGWRIAIGKLAGQNNPALNLKHLKHQSWAIFRISLSDRFRNQPSNCWVQCGLTYPPGISISKEWWKNNYPGGSGLWSDHSKSEDPHGSFRMAW